MENEHISPLEAQSKGIQACVTEPVKTPLKMKYEAEKAQIIKRIGGIEDVRAQLGFSKRKMAQLLMVDPSAWTRWIKRPETVPPATFRALEWYLLVQKKHPALSDGVWLNFLGVKESQQSRSEVESFVESKVSASEHRLVRKLENAFMWSQARSSKKDRLLMLGGLFMAFILGISVGINL